MRICEDCKHLGEKSKESFSQTERIFLLTSVTSMMKFINASADAPHIDKLVGNSITTKLLISFPDSTRDALLKQLRTSAGIDITMKDCPHGVEVIQSGAV